MTDKPNPLAGTTVIDCSTVYAGPMLAQILGDYGAEVVKIEHPVYGDALRGHGQHDEPLSYKWLNRNKKSIGVDLHEATGQAVVEELVEEADVFIENFRPGTLERWGLGWDRLSELNPDLVMVRVTGFGQTGPYRNRPGFGSLIEAMSSFAHITGQPGGPPTLPSLGLADFTCALFGVHTTMMALYWRDVNGGTGQVIDLSLLEPLFSYMGSHAINYTRLGIVPERRGSRSHTSAPRNIYRTKDDRWVAVSGATEGTARRIMKVVGGEDVLEDPRFETMKARLDNIDAVDDLVQSWVGERTRDEVMEIFEEREAPAAPVYNIAEIVEDPQIEARGTMAEVWDEELGETLEMVGLVPKLSETEGRIDWPGPVLGQHTREVLLGMTSLDESEIESLAADGVLTVAE